MEAQVRELFDNIYLRERELTSGEMDFFRSCQKQFRKTKQLSTKQIRILRDILKYLPQDEPIRMTGKQY